MIRIVAFSGETPRIKPRLLAESAAQTALNTRLDDGSISPLRAPVPIETLSADALTIYRHNGDWLGFAGFADAVPGPVAQDRLYVTGDGVPKLIVGGVTYPLAVPAPSAALTAALVSGTVDPDLSSTIVYTYTFVTDFDEESEPAPLSNALLWSPGLDVLLTGFAAAPGGRAISKQRIYRSQTSELGVTNIYLIAERAASAADFTDVVADNPIQEPLPSEDYSPPPDGLTGITSLPNGMMAAFSGKRLYFCEPYKPHAWPEKYALTVDFPIVGLGAFGSMVAVMTTGSPVIVQGTSPDTMSMERIEETLPCVSAAGIVDLGYAVAYPSTEGLVTISAQGTALRTREIFTPKQWRALSPASFRASRYEGRYIASYEATPGTRKIITIDMTGDMPFLLRSDIAANAMFYDNGTGELFMLAGARSVRQWDADTAPLLSQVWRSKLFYMPTPLNYGAILVQGTRLIGQTFTAKVYADGVLRHITGKLNEADRLPGNFLAERWEVEVTGLAEITSISLASSPSEFAQ